MKSLILITILFFMFSTGFSQEPTKKNYESFEFFLNDQNESIKKLDIGLNMTQTKEIMGDAIIVNIPKTGKR